MNTRQTFLDNFNFHETKLDATEPRKELILGLQNNKKYIPAKFFYDERGSNLFDKITITPEYYPTRTEKSILTDQADDIANTIGAGCTLIEPGSGSSEKVRLLLDKLLPNCYVPMDISRDYLYKVSQQLAIEYPALQVDAVCSDYTAEMAIPNSIPKNKRVAFYPGSTIGNFDPEDARDFLSQIRHMVGDDGGLLIGVDLEKDKHILDAAYNDADGYTEAFNLNILNNVNSHLGTEIDSSLFTHCAHYNQDLSRIEMHLVSTARQQLSVADVQLEFFDGESIHTENSYKFTIDSFQKLALAAGFTAAKVWTDDEELFSVHYLKAA
ncbi:MAG: dimethylhistidine N-methyltransferase [Oceanicoccus sp.]|jgi:dimethylhistidine N-methyltransferase